MAINYRPALPISDSLLFALTSPNPLGKIFSIYLYIPTISASGLPMDTHNLQNIQPAETNLPAKVYPRWLSYASAVSLIGVPLGLLAVVVSPNQVSGLIFPLALFGLWVSGKKARELS